jgi:hypothetical protein
MISVCFEKCLQVISKPAVTSGGHTPADVVRPWAEGRGLTLPRPLETVCKGDTIR